MVEPLNIHQPKAHRLRNLIDVSGARATDGQALVFRAETGRWEPGDVLMDVAPDSALLGGLPPEAFALVEHDHDDRYALIEHDHDDAYALIDHTHSQYATADHSHNNATTSTAGFMSATDKSKLDGISTAGWLSLAGFASGSGTVELSGSRVDVPGVNFSLGSGSYIYGYSVRFQASLSAYPDYDTEASLAFDGVVDSTTTAWSPLRPGGNTTVTKTGFIVLNSNRTVQLVASYGGGGGVNRAYGSGATAWALKIG